MRTSIQLSVSTPGTEKLRITSCVRSPVLWYLLDVMLMEYTARTTASYTIQFVEIVVPSVMAYIKSTSILAVQAKFLYERDKPFGQWQRGTRLRPKWMMIICLDYS